MSNTSDPSQPETPHISPDELDALRRKLGSLTLRQHKAMMLLGDGMRPAEIGRLLHVSKNTVGFHLKRVMRKLGVRDRRILLVYAVLLKRAEEEPPPHPPVRAT